MRTNISNKPIYIFVLLMGILVATANLYSDESNINNPLGFKFGTSSKDAKNIIKSNGYEILKNEVDSKDVRTILFNGIIVEYPSINENDKKTRLEFFKDRLMSTQLIVKNLSGSRFVEIQNELINSIETDYGEPNSKDHMLSYNIWTWKTEDLKLILSTNRNKGEVKLEYTYMPVAYSKAEKELEFKRKGKVRSPSDAMFKDGNYSQETGTGLGRSILDKQ